MNLRRLLYTALGAALLLTGVGCTSSDGVEPAASTVVSLVPSTSVVTVTESVAGSPSPSSVPVSVSTSEPSALTGLDDASRQWTLTVIGDSTGTESYGWVHDLGKRLGQAYGRSVVVNDWDLDSESYDEPVTYEYPDDASSTEAEIVIWNGSASGETGGYALEHFEDMVPEQPDVVIINHGHNNGTSEEAVDEIDEVASTLLDSFDAAPAIYITLQNPRSDFDADKAQTTAELLTAKYATGPYPLIDVYGAFLATGDLDTVLTDDGLHPNEAGSVLWAWVAAQALGVPGV